MTFNAEENTIVVALTYSQHAYVPLLQYYRWIKGLDVASAGVSLSL